ncbi:MAG TPA: hypothetical protein PLM07_10485 [Candidatus Rifleibacterium sp.]|nr:hypothetical protein [Candidatus Rifleibacterium sp.]HPT46317.1 hypothetical protein [Candidatus Rifleibacterium sp.]
MRKVNFTSFPKNFASAPSCRYTAGPEGVNKLHKQWSDNLKARSLARRMTFSTGAHTIKIDGLKDFRIKFVLSR